MRQEVSELLKDPEFMEKITDEKDKEKVKKLFSEKGINLNDEELDNIGKEIYDSLVLASELSDEQVESVSGGIDWETIQSKYKASRDWVLKKVGLATPEEEQALIDQISENEERREIAKTQDTWMEIVDRNKKTISIGAAAVTLCAIYGVKNIKRYLNKSRKRKNWINSQKS